MFSTLPLALNIAIFAAAAAVVWVAGSRLAHSADEIAGRTGIGQALLGMLLLGAVTSLPELAIAVTSGIAGTPALSTNDVLGSAACNLVVLALADFFVRHRPLSAAPGSAPLLLQGTFGVVLFGITLGPTIVGDRVVLGLGVWSWLLVAGYLVALRVLSKTTAPERWQPLGVEGRGDDDAADDGERRSKRRLVIVTVSAALAILAAGFLLARTGEAIAHQSGLGTGFFGVAFVAVTTSLPEVSTVITAVRLTRYEMAIADVLGTNLFNVVIIALNDALYTKDSSVLIEVGPSAALGALTALLLTGVYMVGMIERRDRTLFHMGYDSVAIIAIWIASLVVQWTLRG